VAVFKTSSVALAGRARDLFCMVNGLLKKLALAGMVGASVLLGARDVKAAPFLWDSYQDIVPTTNPNNGNPISSVSYTSSSTVNAQNNFSAVYFILASTGPKPVGGFDVRNGQVTSSSFNSYGAYYGLWTDDTANSGDNANLQNHYPGYWEVFYDTNGNGNYGLADTSVAGAFLDRNEAIGDYDISQFTAFNPNAPGTFTFTANIPEPSTGVLTALGLSALALPNGTNVIHFRIAVTNLSSFRLECRDSLTNAAWTSLGTFSATGAVTEVSDTNTAPARFYRAVSP